LEEMPASEEEIEECKEEGIEIHFLTNPTRVIGENGRVKAIECVKMRLGEPRFRVPHRNGLGDSSHRAGIRLGLPHGGVCLHLK
jgi:NADPH-dependent glutamate synthase beta subunit-like oxidoreductase